MTRVRKNARVGVIAAWIGAVGAVVVALIALLGPKILGDKSRLETSTEELRRILEDRWQQVDTFLAGIGAVRFITDVERQSLFGLRNELKVACELHSAALEKGNSVLAHERFAQVQKTLTAIDEQLTTLRDKYPEDKKKVDFPHKEMWDNGTLREMSYQEKREPEGFWSRIWHWITQS